MFNLPWLSDALLPQPFNTFPWASCLPCPGREPRPWKGSSEAHIHSSQNLTRPLCDNNDSLLWRFRRFAYVKRFDSIYDLAFFNVRYHSAMEGY